MGEEVNIIWLSYHEPEIIARGYWDQGMLEDIFKQIDGEHNYNFNWIQASELPEEQPGAIVIINGRTHAEDIDTLNRDITDLRWCILIITGDEEALFPWQQVKHPMLRTWVMHPRMNQHNDVSFKMPNGYRPNTRELLAEIGIQDRKLDWSFIGQVNHERRQQCLDVLNQFKPLYPNSFITGTDSFGKEEIPYPEYLKIMAQSKIVLCPSGMETPDSFRLYEALEAGCIPVVDAFSTKFKTPGFWRYLFGEDPPFPIVTYWDELPQLLPTLLKEYPDNANRIFAWWQQYKRKMKLTLFDQIEELNK